MLESAVADASSDESGTIDCAVRCAFASEPCLRLRVRDLRAFRELDCLSGRCHLWPLHDGVFVLLLSIIDSSDRTLAERRYSEVQLGATAIVKKRSTTSILSELIACWLPKGPALSSCL